MFRGYEKKHATITTFIYWIELDAVILAHWCDHKFIQTLFNSHYVTWINELKVHNYELEKTSATPTNEKKKINNNKNLIHFWITMVKMKYFVWHEKARWTTVITNNIYIFRALICMNLIFDILFVCEWVDTFTYFVFAVVCSGMKRVQFPWLLPSCINKYNVYVYQFFFFFIFSFASINTIQETRLQLMYGVDIIVVGFCFSLQKSFFLLSTLDLKQYKSYKRKE